MLKDSATLLLVSHSNDQIKQLCKKAIWLRGGEMVMSGGAYEVCDAYAKYYE
jgi:ABC-type polysaccharide/polyol phosphate transport system ATPase subunit